LPVAVRSMAGLGFVSLTFVVLLFECHFPKVRTQLMPFDCIVKDLKSSLACVDVLRIWRVV
jgi:hypothetical protein